MLNLKVGGIAAVVSFTLSFLIGLVSGNSMPALLLRPLIFGAVFFAAACLIRFLVSRFLPELLDDEENGIHLPGSRIDITLDGAEDADAAHYQKASRDYRENQARGLTPAVPGAAPSGEEAAEGDVGNISDLMNRGFAPGGSGSAAGMDQDAGDGYTDTGLIDEFAEGETAAGRPGRVDAAEARGGSFAETAGNTKGGTSRDVSDGIDVLPDLESMAGAFLPSALSEDADTPEYSASSVPRKPLSGKKAPAWAGDFNAKDLAAGLRTVLNKEKEG